MATKAKPQSRTRLQWREAEKKVTPAIKILSQYMYSTSPEAPKRDFHGYSVPAGTFTDGHGVSWQLQVSAICSKSKFIKRNEITPLIRKWAVMFKLRLFAKVFIDKVFKDEMAGQYKK